MDNTYLNDRYHKWFKIIDGLMVNNRDAFFEALYRAMTNHPTYVITSDLENDRKKTILDIMLKHFETKEEFEKCASIFNIKNKLN